ncbi:MAG: MJ0042-type zinc finger domain-containing protein [Alphaproteobacteria bacterium]
MVKSFAIIVQCPVCSAQFEAELKEFAAYSRQVRCSNCQHVWRISKQDALQSQPVPMDPAYEGLDEKVANTPESDDIVTEEVAEEETDEALEEEFVSAHSFFGRRLFMIVVLLGLISSGLYFGKNSVVELLPEAQPLYDTLNISTISSSHFKLRDTSWSRTTYNDRPSVIVKGFVENTSQSVRQAPQIQIKLNGTGECMPASWFDEFINFGTKSDPSRCLLYQSTVAPEKDVVLPGEKVEFSSVYPYVESAKIKEVLVDFAP